MQVSQHFADGETFGVYGEIITAQAARPEKAEEDKIPVTILTGFLGAGKTTLLNYILQEQKEKKIAIIENEFGEVSIDDSLLKQEKLALAEKIVVMDNGCMCCTIRGDLLGGLQEIIDAIKGGSGIDQVMIETTGMADPVPIVRTFMSSPEVTQDLRLDAVVTVADSKNLPKRLDDTVEEGKVNEAFQQVAFADKIILNKLDLVSSEEAIAIKDRIRSINTFAKIIPAVKGKVKMSELCNIRAHDICNFVNEDIDKDAEEAPELSHGGHGGHEGHGEHGGHGGHDADCTEDHGHGGHSGHGGESHGGYGGHGDGHAAGHGDGHAAGHGHKASSRHDGRVNSFSIVREGEIVPRRLSAWMQSLGQLPPERGTIYRIKAILAVKGHPYKHVFHAVMDISDEDDAGPWQEGEKKVSKIVFIGKSLDQKFLREGFEAIFE
ncbi:COBW domain-containing protein 1 (Cobalamin synthase W domain-containing protein 1) [Durusdinium trenchii]|uniref:COBW domain-containing protein 1 (Cobalamin synthase W domain-containing protein 1) n=1 Tax=Durusdinium trenchii TaxID=1381693 RepID=A0ABP0RAS5_9DINO